MYFTLYGPISTTICPKTPQSDLKILPFLIFSEKFLTAPNFFPQENSSDRKTDHATGHKIKRDKI